MVPGQMVGYKMFLSHQRYNGILPSTYDDETTLDRPTVHPSIVASGPLQDSLMDIRNIVSECVERARDVKVAEELVFVSPPNPIPSAGSTPSRYHNSEINQGPYGLDFDQVANKVFLRHELWLTNALERLDATAGCDDSGVRTARKQAVEVIHLELSRLETMKESEWKRQEKQLNRVRRVVAEGKTEVVDTRRYLTPLSLFGSPAIFIFRLIATALLLMCRVSIAHCGFVLLAIRSLVAVVSYAGSSTDSLVSSLEPDVNGALSSLDLRPSHREYICCPKCFACYPVASNPSHCSSRLSPSEPECGQRLQRNDERRRRGRATKRYLHHDMKQWLGRMLCRPNMESYLDRDVYDTGASPGEMRDIWDGRVLKGFQDQEGNLFVKPKDKTEGRYVFSLNMDGFNPFGNKIARKKVSCGAIYMVCLNLPPHLRFRPENIFLVGIIPGPSHPSISQANHFLRILVDELLVFWNRGVYFTRTFSYTKGRLVRCALVPVVCDLPAARQVMGFAGHSAANFCCYCGLLHADINNVDVSTWPRGFTRAEYLERAEQWRDAPLWQQDTLFDDHGIRWSELLRLPYWDPTRFVVLDCMHLCYLGLYKRHCREVWGMSVDLADGDGVKEKEHLPDAWEVERAWDIVKGGTLKQLGTLNLPILQFLCTQINIPVKSNKTECAQAIEEYVSGDHALSIFLNDISLLQRYRAGYLKPDGTPVKPWVKPSLPVGPVTLDEAQKTADILWGSATISAVKDRGVRKSALEVVATTWVDYLRETNSFQQSPRTQDEHDDTTNGSGSEPEEPDFLSEASFANMTRDQLIGSMLSMRSTLHSALGDIGHAPRQRHVKRAGVLGRATLQEIWHDIEAMVLPSWSGWLRSGIGKPAHGKLKADEWKTFCHVSLVHTLPRLWCRESGKPNRYTEILDNYMDLITATQLASSRVITTRIVSRYSVVIQKYLKGLRRLFPEIPIAPNQHLSAHLAPMLLDFGPTHAWRCFPFERYNYILQQINTSMKFGELEATMFERFCMMQNLRALMQTTLPREVDTMQTAFLALFENDYRGSLLYDVWAPDAFELPVYRNTSVSKALDDPIWSILKPHLTVMFSGRPVRQRVLFQKSVTLRGQTFSIRSTTSVSQRGLGNSNIIWGRLTSTEWKAGQINSIFVWKTSEKEVVFLAVDELKQLSNEEHKHDPYRKFPLSVAGRIFCTKTHSAPRILTLEQVACHFAAIPYTSGALRDGYMHVIPMQRT